MNFSGFLECWDWYVQDPNKILTGQNGLLDKTKLGGSKENCIKRN